MSYQKQFSEFWQSMKAGNPDKRWGKKELAAARAEFADQYQSAKKPVKTPSVKKRKKTISFKRPAKKSSTKIEEQKGEVISLDDLYAFLRSIRNVSSLPACGHSSCSLVRRADPLPLAFSIGYPSAPEYNAYVYLTRDSEEIPPLNGHNIAGVIKIMFEVEVAKLTPGFHFSRSEFDVPLFEHAIYSIIKPKTIVITVPFASLKALS